MEESHLLQLRNTYTDTYISYIMQRSKRNLWFLTLQLYRLSTPVRETLLESLALGLFLVVKHLWGQWCELSSDWWAPDRNGGLKKRHAQSLMTTLVFLGLLGLVRSAQLIQKCADNCLVLPAEPQQSGGVNRMLFNGYHPSKVTQPPL